MIISTFDRIFIRLLILLYPCNSPFIHSALDTTRQKPGQCERIKTRTDARTKWAQSCTINDVLTTDAMCVPNRTQLPSVSNRPTCRFAVAPVSHTLALTPHESCCAHLIRALSQPTLIPAFTSRSGVAGMRSGVQARRLAMLHGERALPFSRCALVCGVSERE